MDRNELRRLLLFAAAVLALCFLYLAYRPALDGAFIWDDHAFAQADAGYRHASLTELMTRSFWPESPFADARAPYYRPLVLLSYRLDLSLGGTPKEFHFTNVALHLVTCILLAVVAVRAGASTASAMLGSVLWGAFPRLTEAVAWIAGRTDVLAAFFGFAALALWPETGGSTTNRSAKDDPRAWARSLTSGALLFCALASKEVAVAFAAAMALAALLRRTAPLRPAVALGVPLAAYFALRTIAFAHLDIPPSRELGFGLRLLTVFEAVERYAEMSVDPFHPRTSIGMLGDPDPTRAAIGVVVVLATIALGVHVVRRGSFGVRLAFGLGLVAIAPVIQIIPLPLTSAVVADRLLYVPLAAVAIGLATQLRHRAFAALALVLALAFGRTTSARASEYREETAFWTIAAENADPHNTAARMGLARWLSTSEPEVACPLYERALAILDAQGLESRPPHRRARESLASCWARIGRYDDALRMNRDLARDFPTRARVMLELGFAELHVRNFDAAGAAFDQASKLERGALARFVVTKPELEAVRAEEARFGELGALERATHLGDLGRAADAATAFHAIAMNANEAEPARQRATKYLMEFAPFALAEEALAVVPPPRFGWTTRLEELFAHRTAIHRAVVPLRGRIDALRH